MSDLTDRMRTCAAYLIGAANAGDGGLRDFGQAIIDAADLLIEASNALEAAPAPLGEPMAIIPPVPTPIPPASTGNVWIAPGGPLPGLQQSGTVSPRACPRCDSRAGKTVRRIDGRMMLKCPACGHQWQYQPSSRT